MGPHLSNTVRDIQTVQNNILQVTHEDCKGKCQNYQGDVSVVVAGTVIAGNFGLVQECQVHTDCVMRQQVGSQVQNIMQDIAEQTQSMETSPLSFSVGDENNNIQIQQSITNSITQILLASCQADSSNIAQGNMVVLSDDVIGGNFYLAQKGGAISNCSMTNLAKQIAFNKQIAKETQEQKVESIFAIIAIAIVVGIVFIVLIVVITLGPSGLKGIAGAVGGGGAAGGGKEEGGGGGSGGALKFIEENPELLL